MIKKYIRKYLWFLIVVCFSVTFSLNRLFRPKRMGFDISFLDVDINGFATCVYESYLSYNFGNEMFNKYFHIRDIDGEIAKTANDSIKSALLKMQKNGFTKGVPDMNNTNWAWAVDKESKVLPEDQAIGVFMFHLYDLCKQLEQQPASYFVLDFHKSATMKDMRVVVKNPKSKYAKCNVTYFRHPIKGQYKVDSFSKAMEVYGILASHNNNEEAQMWFDLAFRMFGAPIFK